jgi:hypothetical protein
MRFKKIVLALFACLALGAFAANAAQAAEGDGWTVGTAENQTSGGTLIPNGTHERVSCRKHGKSPLVLSSSLFGSAVELTAEGVDCLEKAGSTKLETIDNTTGKGHSEGVLTFTAVKVVKPANCEVGGPTHDLTSMALTDEVIMDPTVGSTVVFDRFVPELAANAFIGITFEGPLCALSGSTIPVKGTVCGEAVHTNAAGTGFEPNKTGTLTKVQTLLLGSAQQTTGNSAAKPCALTAFTKSAQITGAVDFELESGKPFGAD